MRAAAVCLALVMSGGYGAAKAEGPSPNPPVKWIKIVNDSGLTLFPIIQAGRVDTDQWLQSVARVPPAELASRTYSTTRDYRLYVGRKAGMPPGSTIYVQLPFYSQLVPGNNLNGRTPDQFVDWWNGGRVLFYDIKSQIVDDFDRDVSGEVFPVADVPLTCKTFASGACQAPTTKLRVLSGGGLPSTDLSQLMEFTFGDAITANGAPYPFNQVNVGYNISSVDQVYLPVAMEPFGNPFIPYIGTTIKVNRFRRAMESWLADWDGWPIYQTSSPAKPRIPGAYVALADHTDLTPPGKSVDDLTTLYNTCTQTSNDHSQVCVTYRTVNDLFAANFRKFESLSCADKNIKFSPLVVSKIYGWVPFNEGCGAGANALSKTFGDTKDDEKRVVLIQDDYIKLLQYSTGSPRFNPYVSLIHDSKYLDMAAYAFSVDDAVSFQHYPGTGLILDFAGKSGLDNGNKLDLSKKIEVTAGLTQVVFPEWIKYGVCSSRPDSGELSPTISSFSIWPQSFPCEITLEDVNSKLYHFTILSGPPKLATTTCDQNTPAGWCAPAVSANNINTNAYIP